MLGPHGALSSMPLREVGQLSTCSTTTTFGPPSGPLPSSHPLSCWCSRLAGGTQRAPYITKQTLTRRIPQKSAVNSPALRYPPRAHAPRSPARQKRFPSRRRILHCQYKLDTGYCAEPKTRHPPLANRVRFRPQAFSRLSCGACTPRPQPDSRQSVLRGRNNKTKLPIRRPARIGHPLALLAPAVRSGPLLSTIRHIARG
jgi:hypothetical protein